MLSLREEVQFLKDEINRLKGEKGIPEFKQTHSSKSKDISSEKERDNKEQNDNNKSGGRGSRGKSNRRKKSQLEIHETIILPIDKSGMPDDVEFKGYKDKIIKGLSLQQHNTRVKCPFFYSPSHKARFSVEIPPEYRSGFSAELQALIIDLKYERKMSESNILGLLNSYKIEISAGSISNILLNNGNCFIPEKTEIAKAGFQTSAYIQTDTTACSEKGEGKQSHVFSGEHFSAFYTTDDRKRTTIIDILRAFQARVFALNELFFETLRRKNVSTKHIGKLEENKTDKLLSESDILSILAPFEAKKNLYSIFYEVSYITGFHCEEGFNSAQVLLTDDASIYDNISFNHALCWIHEGRHFKKLNPLVEDFRLELNEFLTSFWNYYHALLDFKQNPCSEYAELLSNKFDSLFTKEYSYDELNDRIHKLYAKKEELLVVLNCPYIPLHNNESELLARKIARFRDVSFHTMSKVGTEVRDSFYTVFETAKKLGVCARDYIIDRISGKYHLNSLADRILNMPIPLF